MVTLQSWTANTQGLTAVSALASDDQFRVVQGGVSKSLTAAVLLAYISATVGLTVGAATISGGTSGYVLYNNAGVLGELATTGSGSVVRATSPTLVTPALGTPSALVLTNATGLPVASIVGDTTTTLGVGSINLGHASDTTLTRVSAGVVAIEGVNILTTATGQPLDADLTSWAAITRASGFDAFAATPSSANLAALLTDETGSGANVFANTPTLVTPVIGAATGTSLTVTGALYAYSGTAIPAGGTTGAGVKFSATSNFGLFFGSGAPTLSAAQGSIYIRSDGTSTTGVYTNTNGSTTWATVSAMTSPGGSTTQVQYNNAGAFAGAAGFTFNGTAGLTLGVAATSTGSLTLSNATSGAAILTSDAANTLALRNSTNAQTFRAYNTYTDSSNGEWGTFDWSSSVNVLTIGTNKNGTGSTRNFRFVAGGTAVADYGVTTASAWTLNGNLTNTGDFVTAGTAFAIGNGDGKARMYNNGQFGWSSASGVSGSSTIDCLFAREAVGIIALRGSSTTTPGALTFYTYGSSPPSAPSASIARLYADTSGGKIRLMAIFPSGAAQQIAIEP